MPTLFVDVNVMSSLFQGLGYTHGCTGEEMEETQTLEKHKSWPDFTSSRHRVTQEGNSALRKGSSLFVQLPSPSYVKCPAITPT